MIPKVSVIVPVYNVEKYLDKCLYTLVNQSLQEIEIIVVNDGSTDASDKIIEEYNSKYPEKLLYLKKENGGISDARNYGIKYARGEYIGFVDSDDYVDLTMFELMYDEGIKSGAEIVQCNLNYTYENYEKTEIIEKYYEKDYLIAFGSMIVCNKILKREWLEKIQVSFPKGINHEDVFYCCILYPNITKLSYIDAPCLHYVQRSTSISHCRTEKLKDINIIFSMLLSEFQKRSILDEYYFALEALATHVVLGSALKRFCRVKDKKTRRKLLEDNWDFLNRNFPTWKTNTYIKDHKGLKYKYYQNCNRFTYLVMAGILVVVNGFLG